MTVLGMQLNSLYKTLALVLLMPAFNVTGTELESALKAALEETPRGPVNLHTPAFKLFRHTFGVQPVELIEKQKGKHTLSGKLTRIVAPGRENDDIVYRIIKVKGAIREITWQVNGGEWHPLSEAMMNALGDYRNGVPMPEEKQRQVEGALEKAVDESWQRAVEFLIAHIAVRHC